MVQLMLDYLVYISGVILVIVMLVIGYTHLTKPVQQEIQYPKCSYQSNLISETFDIQSRTLTCTYIQTYGKALQVVTKKF